MYVYVYVCLTLSVVWLQSPRHHRHTPRLHQSDSCAPLQAHPLVQTTCGSLDAPCLPLMMTDYAVQVSSGGRYVCIERGRVKMEGVLFAFHLFALKVLKQIISLPPSIFTYHTYTYTRTQFLFYTITPPLTITTHPLIRPPDWPRGGSTPCRCGQSDSREGPRPP